MGTDLELVNATLSGDKSAFGVLVSRYQTQVYRLAYRIVSNSSAASDVAQEALLKAYQNLEQLKDRSKFPLWLFQIAKNQSISWIRKYQENLAAVEDELDNDRLHLPPAPDEILIQRELHEQVMEAIAKLPEHNRKAAQMFYLEDRSYSEIQDELGITKGTLGRLLYEARVELRKSLKRAYQGVLLWVSNGLKRMLRLIPGQIGTIADTSILSTAKYLVISIMLHLVFFAGISITALLWGTSNGTNNRADYDSVVDTSLAKSRVSDLMPLPLYIHAKLPSRRHTRRNSLKPVQSAEIAAARRVIHKLPKPERLRPRIPQSISTPAGSSQMPGLASAADISRARYFPYPATPDLAATPLHTTIRPKRSQCRPGPERLASADRLRPYTYAMTSDTASAPGAEDSDSLGAKETLPSSYGPFYRYDRPVRNVQKVLSQVAAMAWIRQYRAWILQTEDGRTPIGILEEYTASTLQVMTKDSPFSTVLVSGSDLEVLKAFVASDIAPVVITRSPIGPKHIRALVGYDDTTERLVVIDPIYYAKARFDYSEFCSQWDDPQNACLLVFPQSVVLPETVRNCLARYLPEEKVESISIRVPKRR